MTSVFKDISLFVNQLKSSSSQIGAVVPSGRALGRAMAAEIDPANGPVVEIGPGTGALTRAILAAGVRPADLTLFEMNAEFCPHLRQRFSGVTVHNLMAQEMASLGIKNQGAIISGLPLLNMPPEVQLSIAKAVFTALKPSAPMIQFTYGPKPPLHPDVRAECGLTWTKSKRIWRNIPPATVYVFKQTQSDADNI